jgi:hypothetical protein
VPFFLTLLIFGSIQAFPSLFHLHNISPELKKSNSFLHYQEDNGVRLILLEDLYIEKEEKEENDSVVQNEYSKSSIYPISRTIHSLNFFFESSQSFSYGTNYRLVHYFSKSAFLMLCVFKI